MAKKKKKKKATRKAAKRKGLRCGNMVVNGKRRRICRNSKGQIKSNTRA